MVVFVVVLVVVGGARGSGCIVTVTAVVVLVTSIIISIVMVSVHATQLVDVTIVVVTVVVRRDTEVERIIMVGSARGHRLDMLIDCPLPPSWQIVGSSGKSQHGYQSEPRKELGRGTGGSQACTECRK
ncbi:hypothetical protein EDB85DRAFT_1894480 [Lactarius pseudohatsudake]|nr:hypothetical protein EDB85DRAFT_1894480 [Lactarius pseudohatsudake]